MVRVMEAVGIGKVGVLASQLLGLVVHHAHKGVDVTAHRLGQNLGGLIGRGEQQAVQKLLHRQHLPRLNIGRGAALWG